MHEINIRIKQKYSVYGQQIYETTLIPHPLPPPPLVEVAGREDSPWLGTIHNLKESVDSTIKETDCKMYNHHTITSQLKERCILAGNLTRIK